MTITMELSDREVQFLNKMIRDMGSYKQISGIEEAVRECIQMATYDESEPMADDEGV